MIEETILDDRKSLESPIFSPKIEQILKYYILVSETVFIISLDDRNSWECPKF